MGIFTRLGRRLKNSEISTRYLTVLIKSVIFLIEQENQVPERAPFQ